MLTSFPRVVAALGVFLVFVLVPAQAFAQNPARVGLTMGLPGSVGLLWQVAEPVAIWPEFSFMRRTVDVTSSTPFGLVDASAGGWVVGGRVSARLYVGKWDRLRTFVSPALAWSKASAIESDVLTFGDGETTSRSVTGAFGAQYGLSDRFGLFGQIGLDYSRSKTTSGLGIDATLREFGTVSSAGVILFF